jgi:hypothetical protein
MRKIIEDNVDLSKLHLTKLLDLSDVEVTGDFYCDFNNLTSLVGSPHTVRGSFYCGNNNLTSLEGIPKTIDRNFFIDEILEDRFPEKYIRSLSRIKGIVVYV